MAAKVVDASAIAALLFGEPEAGSVAGQLRDGRLFAPPLLWIEVANVCLKKMRRHPELRTSLRAAFRLLDGLTIERADVNHGEVLDLANDTGLTVYDAGYLLLARKLDAALVTLDQQLASANAAVPQKRV